MHLLTRAYVRIQEHKGQSMTEYALILSAVVVIAFLAYDELGEKLGSLIDNLVSDF